MNIFHMKPATAPNSPHTESRTSPLTNPRPSLRSRRSTGHVAEYILSDGTESDESTPAASDDSDDDMCEIGEVDDGVQCTMCYRIYCRDDWSEWPVVSGFETVCAACIDRQDAED